MKRWSVSRLLFSMTLIVIVSGISLAPRPAQAKAAISTIFGLHVSGNQLQNQAGENVRLLGVNRPGTEYKCVNNASIFDGPDDKASVNAMASWHINTVRVPLNEDCWLSINGAQNQYSGTAYRQAVQNYVNLLVSKGLIPVLDLHWNAPGGDTAFGQQPMPDADHSYDFWYSVAATFQGYSSVIFNLYNEPHADDGACWKDGSSAPYAAPCSGVGFAVAGMQGLVTKVRQTGAHNVIMLDGWGFANYIGGVLNSLPSDPDNNLMISAHVYTDSGCASIDCFNQQYLPVAQKLPVVLGEIGEKDCQHSFIDPVMNWADGNNIGYLGWAWVVNDCAAYPSLINDYNGNPSPFGVGLKDHLASIN